MQIWSQSNLYLIFPIFDCFQLLACILVGFAYLVQVGKCMILILTFLASYWYVFYPKIPPGAWENPLCQLEKSISTCAI